MTSQTAENIKAIETWIDQNEQKLISLIQDMVREPSTQMNEAGIQQKMAGWLEELGFAIDMWEPGGDELFNHPDFISRRENFHGSPNVAGVLKGEGGGRSLLLNGHVDVVPEGDVTDWSDDPYAGRLINGFIYGRGSTDMKGGNAAMLFALEALQSLNIPLKGDVVFQSVVEEESGGAGTLAAILRGYTADAALIPEPTNMKLFPKQQGSQWFRLKVKGKSAHGGTSYEGVNAIQLLRPVLRKLETLEQIRNSRVTDPLFAKSPIPLPVNVGVVEGGEWPSSVPDLVKVEGRIGISPEETAEDARKELEEAVKSLGEDNEWFQLHPVEVEWFGARWLPGAIETDHPFMSILKDNYKSVAGEEPAVEAAPWGTDGGIITAVGKTPTVVFGPGVTKMAHQADEYIAVEDVKKCSAVIAATIADWCNTEKDEGGNENGNG